MTGFYVSVIDRQRKGLLLGPFPTHAEALAKVEKGKALAHEVNRDAHWFAYGTCKVTANELPQGRLNHLREETA